MSFLLEKRTKLFYRKLLVDVIKLVVTIATASLVRDKQRLATPARVEAVAVAVNGIIGVIEVSTKNSTSTVIEKLFTQANLRNTTRL